MSLMDDFIIWEESIRMDVDHIKGILSLNLSDEPESLIKDLEASEVWGSRAGFLLADANSWLDKARKYYQPDKEGRTELDRKAIVDAAVTEIRKVRDYIEVLVDSIRQRLILGASILAYFRQFKDPVVIQQPDYSPKKALSESPW